MTDTYDTERRLCKMSIRRDSIEGPRQLPPASWANARFRSWQKKYPESYSWDRNYGALGEYDTPDVEEIRQSVIGLDPILPDDLELLTLVPEADLFGFQFFITGSTSWLGERTRIATAPSVPWLATVRQLPVPHSLTIKAWLGDPSHADQAVLVAREQLLPILNRYNAEILKSHAPTDFGRTDIGVILAHGSRGLSRSFAGLNDVGQFSIEELASHLGQCRCVILFVCNAGRTDATYLTKETVGIVGQLLRLDVRAVIAPPAPMRFTLPAQWLPTFLERIEAEEDIYDAYAGACAAVRRQFSHPFAWGALQLFGDPLLRFKRSVSR
jgi:hypothetical protein